MIRWLSSLASRSPWVPSAFAVAAPRASTPPGFDPDKSKALSTFITKTEVAYLMADCGYVDLAQGKLDGRPTLTPDLVAYARSNGGKQANDIMRTASLVARVMPNARVDDGQGGTITVGEQLGCFQTVFPEYATR